MTTQQLQFLLEMFIRLLLSSVLGGVVGLERKRRKKEAGIRTHAMVALGSTLFTIVSKYGFLDLLSIEGASVDLSRVAANIVTGVCFLGAGMIFVKSKSITGLTTAAGIWVVSAIGLSIGCGLYVIGIATTVIIVIIQFFLYKSLYRLEGPSTREICCVIEDYKHNLELLDSLLKEIDPSVYYSLMKRNSDGSMVLKFKIKVRQSTAVENIYDFFNKHSYIRSISC